LPVRRSGPQSAFYHRPSLTWTIRAPDRVFGLAVMDKKLYVLRQRPDKQIYVYTSDNYELTDDYITLPQFTVKVLP